MRWSIQYWCHSLNGSGFNKELQFHLLKSLAGAEATKLPGVISIAERLADLGNPKWGFLRAEVAIAQLG